MFYFRFPLSLPKEKSLSTASFQSIRTEFMCLSILHKLGRVVRRALSFIYYSLHALTPARSSW